MKRVDKIAETMSRLQESNELTEETEFERAMNAVKKVKGKGGTAYMGVKNGKTLVAIEDNTGKELFFDVYDDTTEYQKAFTKALKANNITPVLYPPHGNMPKGLKLTKAEQY